MLFITVDIEAYERDHGKVTEIGIATLDSRDLSGIAPGTDGRNWTSKIRARHFRIEEHSHLSNKLFVQSCADRFEFGETQWVTLPGVRRMIALCFRNDATVPEARVPAERRQQPMTDDETYNTGRNIVLLGHAVDNDIRYLEGLNYIVRLVQHFVEAIDLGLMDRQIKGLQQSRALASILYDLDIVGWNLHNAGNDAYYTLQAMIVMALRHRVVDKVVEPVKIRMKAAEDVDDDDGTDDGAPRGLGRHPGSRQVRSTVCVGTICSSVAAGR